MRPYFLLIFCFALTMQTIDLKAQRKKSKKQADTTFSESLYNSIQWRLVGPFRGGRAGTVAGVVNDPNTYYMGTAGGGAWKTEDAGNTWFSISDGYFGGSIGVVAVSESDPNIIYIGEGEQTLRGNVSSGNGIWKSLDAGKSWSFIGLKGTEHISRIRIHPKNPNIVYVAAIGNLWKPNKNRGVYRSNDGGQSWDKILYESDKAGAGDLIIDPNNARIIYASTWQMKRNGYRMDSGGNDSKLFKSFDGGNTWINITKNSGLPKGPWGIVGITVSPVDSNRIWTIIEAANGGVFRSDDAGVTWQKVNENRALRQRAWYYSRIYADTQNKDKVYVMNVSYGVSTDGGKSFTLKDAPHGDHHDLWIDPNNNNRMIIADDGGAQISNDGGNNWSTYYNQPTAQFYRVTTDNQFPYRIYGAQQDNTTIRISHRSSESSIGEKDWEVTAGGESAHLAPDPKNNNIVYGGTYKGYMMRKDHQINQTRSVNIWPDNPAGSGAEVMKYRFNWNFPIKFSIHNSQKLYAGSNFLHLTTNEGQSWKTISPDLTRGIPETIKSSGGPITQDNTGAEFYSNIFAINESPLEEGIIWVGSDDGLIHISKNNGQTWENITPPGSINPKLNMINCIDPSPFQKGTAYVAATSYKFGDYTPYLYKTKDYGKTWSLITKGIPNNYYTRAIRSDKIREGLLYAGTEWGMFVSFDDGKSWKSFQLNLPISSIRDLHVRDNDLIAATHGRSFWMIDDLTPLHQLDERLSLENFHLYKPEKAYRFDQSKENDDINYKLVGENHPNGAILHFFIKKLNKKDKISIEIKEKDGTLIQRFSNNAMLNNLNPESDLPLKVNSGSNRLVWNMRYPGFKEFEGMVFYSSPNLGPKAVPGDYIISLNYNGDKKERKLQIVKDPRLKNSDQDYKQQFEFLTNVRDQVSRANSTIIKIREVRKDLNYLKEKEGVGLKIKDYINQFEKELNKIENNIHMTKNQSRQDPLNYGIRINNRIAFLLADSQRGDYPPTDQAKAFFKDVLLELDEQINALEKLLEVNISKLNEIVSNNEIEIFSMKSP